ncbi:MULTISPECIES: hypothetical protein [Pseudomonas]|uniref:hypothetical protein n=1 Tax=Pseudomonas TaxID=286 RepID=UPI001F1F51E5|nr:MULTISPECIES: hypothetical protein [Pseudomonas]
MHAEPNKETFLKNSPAKQSDLDAAHSKRTSTALVCFALAVCGAGIPGLVMADATATSTDSSSAACVNEADFRAGTVVESESRDNLSPALSRSKTETLGPQAFAGVTPVASSHTSYLNGAPFFLTTTFAEVRDGQLIRYGDRHGAGASLVTTTYHPAAAVPIDLQPGQTVDVRYKSQAVSAGATVEYDVTEQLTYSGRETLTTALGTFNTCKFTNRISVGSRAGAQPAPVVVHNWFPAEGPYRGQSIRAVTPAANGVPERITEVVKMQYRAQ